MDFVYSPTSIARTALGPREFVPDVGHWALAIASGRGATGRVFFRSRIELWYVNRTH